MARAPARYPFVMPVILLWLYGAKESRHIPINATPIYPNKTARRD